MPVLVYIHGESYEWNSGNAYDGTVLASYGQVVVVTINFRLGILGFLRPALSERSVSNLGLLDQIAALHWVRENIAVFGGDPKSVTIFGHGTGAALANLLLISPVTQASEGLFHRAILMSGSALSKWAFTWDPYKYTTQVAKALKCPLLGRNDDLANCLRSKTVEELLAVPLDPAPFTTPLGPIMDGTIIKQDELRRILSIDRGTLSKFDLLYGVTSAESFNILNASEVKYGMSKERRNLLLQAYISNTFAHQTAAIYAAVDNEYTTWNSSSRSSPGKRIEMELRDRVLQVLSDAQIVAPVVSMGDLHSSLNSRSYFYVFKHQSLYGDYPSYQGTVHGEELPYVFGAPLVGGFSHFGLNYTLEEQFLSELVITLWTNFAKTGNPNLPTPQGYKTEGAPFNWKENMRTLWPPYDRMNQEYLHIDMQVVKKSHYRAKKLALWNRLIPDLISSSMTPVSFLPSKPTTVNLTPQIKRKPTPRPTPKTYIPRCKPVTIPPASHPYTSYPQKTLDFPPDEEDIAKTLEQTGEAVESSPPPPTYAGTHMSVIIVIGIVILILNCFAIAGFYYKRDHLRLGRSRLSRRESSAKNEESSENLSEANNSLKSQKEDEDKKPKSSNNKISKNRFYNSAELLTNASARISASRESSFKMPNVTPHTSLPSLFSKDGKKSPAAKEQKSNTTKGSKPSPYTHKRNKSENSIYSEVNMQSSPNEGIYQKNRPAKLKNEGSLQPKTMNKSSTSIASIKSTNSIKSNTSRSSVKSNSSSKPVKKNASCQSLPTPEYSWGITPEMTMGTAGKDNIEAKDGKRASERQQAVATMQKKKYPKVLPPEVPFGVETHAATLPKVRPPPPLRSTSLTSRDLEELEDIHVIYRKGRTPKDEHNGNPCGVANMEPFYGTGAGEAPASPTGMYGAADSSTATVRRSRKSDGFEYAPSGMYTQYPPYQPVMQKEAPKIPPAPQIPEPVKNYSFSDSRSSHSSLGTFGRPKETPKPNYNEVKSIHSPIKESSSVNTSTTSSSTDASPQPFHSSGARPSGLTSSSIYFTKPRNDTSLSESKTDEENEASKSPFYNHKENNTGTIKKKSLAASKYQKFPESSDKASSKPLKSVLKTTSAYDKPKPSASGSSLSSSASINLTSPLSSKSIYSIQEHEPDPSSSLKRGTRAIAPPTRTKSHHSEKEEKK